MRRLLVVGALAFFIVSTSPAAPESQLEDLQQQRDNVASTAGQRWVWTGITAGVSLVGFIMMIASPIETNNPVAVGAAIGGGVMWIGGGLASVSFGVASIGPSIKFLELNGKVGQLQAQDRGREVRAERVRKYGARAAAAIENDEIYIGMPRGAVLESWGRPADINRTTTNSGIHEQWVYKTEWTDETYAYVYIEDGRVTAIQD